MSQTNVDTECGDFGACQGSVLAGLFHIINSNDFPACHQEAESVLYVDDDSDHVSDHNPEELIEKIASEANLSAQWLEDNRLCVAADKSKLLIIGTQKLKTSKIGNNEGQYEIKVNDQIIRESSSERLLELTVNNVCFFVQF